MTGQAPCACSLLRPSLRWIAVLFALLSSACGTGTERPAQTTALEPLPIPAHLEEVDPPVREQYQERRTHLDNLLATAGHDDEALAGAYGALGMWHQAYGDHELARLAYQHALAHNPDQPRWLYYLGLVHGLLGDSDAARQALERFLVQRPDDTPARVHLAEIELAAGRTQAAEALLRKVLEQGADNPRALAGLGRLELQQRQFEAAIEHLERALALQPDKAKVEYSLGLAYRGLGDRERAAEHMARGGLDNRNKADAVMADPLLAEIQALDRGSRAHGQRGRRAFVGGDFARAIEESRRAVASNPEAPQPRLNLAAALLRAGRPEEAVAELEEVLRLSPGHPIAHFNLGASLYRLGRLGEAEEQYLAAVTANPGSKEALFNLANLRRFRGDHRAALDNYQRVIELDPGFAPARLWRVVCLCSLGRTAEARRTLENDLDQLRTAAQLQLLYVRLLTHATDPAVRDPARALELARALHRARPSLGAAEAVAGAYARQGEFELAAAWQRTALEAIRELAGGKVLARVSGRLELYHKGRTDDEVWGIDEHRGTDLAVQAPEIARNRK